MRRDRSTRCNDTKRLCPGPGGASSRPKELALASRSWGSLRGGFLGCSGRCRCLRPSFVCVLLPMVRAMSLSSLFAFLSSLSFLSLRSSLLSSLLYFLLFSSLVSLLDSGGELLYWGLLGRSWGDLGRPRGVKTKRWRRCSREAWPLLGTFCESFFLQGS